MRGQVCVYCGREDDRDQGIDVSGWPRTCLDCCMARDPYVFGMTASRLAYARLQAAGCCHAEIHRVQAQAEQDLVDERSMAGRQLRERLRLEGTPLARPAPTRRQRQGEQMKLL